MRRPVDAVWLPYEAHFLLLRAALADSPESGHAWRAWKEATGGIDYLDIGSFRLLPLVYRNLLRTEVEDSSMPVLKGVYRHVWYTNNLLARWAATVLGALDGAGVPTLVLKGAAVASLHYRDLGVRPMDDLDVMVPRERASEVMDLLEGIGFVPQVQHARGAIGIRHAEELEDRQGRIVDLHWSLLWGRQTPAAEDVADASVPVTIGGARARALGAADQLLHVCLHGVSWNFIAPVRWMADAVIIVRSAGSQLDWERLVAMAIASSRTVPLHAALALLRDRLEAPIPDDVLAELARARVSVAERYAHRAIARPPSASRYAGIACLMWSAYRDYLRSSEGTEMSFLTYIQRMGRLDTAWQVPLRLLSRLRAVAAPVPQYARQLSSEAREAP